MNNDLVKRIAVCDMLHEEMEAWGSCADEIEALLKANDALWKIPAVDAVEVVRCWQCKHRESVDCPMCELLIDYDYDFEVVDRTTGNGFCYRGERREDDAAD